VSGHIVYRGLTADWFQGLSNNQVLEHVKAGNTLTIPSGIKPQL
jgi:hypothetical protein